MRNEQQNATRNGQQNALGFLQNGLTFNIFAREVGEWGTKGKWTVMAVMKAVDKKEAEAKLKDKMPWLQPVDSIVYRGGKKEYYVSQVS